MYIDDYTFIDDIADMCLYMKIVFDICIIFMRICIIYNSHAGPTCRFYMVVQSRKHGQLDGNVLSIHADILDTI